jgi:hypothetical protein
MGLSSYAKSMSELAKAGAKIAKQKGTLKDYGKMCETCACRWEQDKTLPYFIAADQAADCLMTDHPFNCHTWDFKCADKPCAGFEFAKLAVVENAKNKIKELKNILS